MDSKVSARWLSGSVLVIREDEWPVVARGSYRESQANLHWRAGVRIRHHADGRVIVCGTYDCATDERNVSAWVGLLIDEDADLFAAIRTVSEALARDAREAGRDYDAHIHAAINGAHIDAAVSGCIENLLVN